MNLDPEPVEEGLPGRAGLGQGQTSTSARRNGADQRRSALKPAQLRDIVEHLPSAIYTTDADGRITYFNEAAATLWGRRPRLGEDWWCGSWRLFWPDGRPMRHDECPMAVTLKTGEPVRGAEAIAERPDGSRFTFVPYPTPLRDRAGRLVGAVNMLVDVTGHRQAELAATRLAAVVESSDNAIISQDLNGIITTWNNSAERLFGYSSDEAIGQPFALVIPSGLIKEDEIALDRIRRGERVEGYEAKRRRKDGTIIEVSVTLSPIESADGRIVGISRIARDITERRRTELAASRLAAIIENSDDAIVSKDLDGIITSWNKSAERLYGYFAEEAIGKPMTLVIPEELLHEEPIILERIRRGERVEGYETKRQRKDGSLVEISLTVSPIRDDRGKIVGASKIARNIAGRRRTEELLRQHTRRFETLNHVAKAISSELDFEHVVQTVTDFATDLSGARFGAFFYSSDRNADQRYQVHASSGLTREAFEKIALPVIAALFEPTSLGIGIVRSDDIRTDPRCGMNGTHRGLAEGPLPFLSYLAVPVISRSGEVLGGLVFGHEQPGVFTRESEQLVSGIAAHAAVAIDNARLHQEAQAEIEQRRRAEETKELLLNEIKHRVNNTLGIVQAIAMQTFRESAKAERDAFGARLRALADAHDLLTGQDWGHASVAELMRRALAPFQERHRDRVRLSGCEASLDSKRALSLSLALHELATNAVKYGALSNGSGSVSVTWDQATEGPASWLKISWQETGGPPVEPPKRKGFGSRLIKLALGNDSNVHLDFAEGGLRCTMEVPI